MQYEYLIDALERVDLSQRLLELGKQGWKLCCYDPNRGVYIFVREKK